MQHCRLRSFVPHGRFVWQGHALFLTVIFEHAGELGHGGARLIERTGCRRRRRREGSRRKPTSWLRRETTVRGAGDEGKEAAPQHRGGYRCKRRDILLTVVCTNSASRARSFRYLKF